MKILILTETLHAGGAETFVVRLANSLSEENDVHLVNIYPKLSEKGLMEQVSKNVSLTNLKFPFHILLSRIDLLLYKCKIDFSLVEVSIQYKLKKIITHFQPEVIHTHLFKPDYYVASIRKLKSEFRHVSTNHGDYLQYEQKDPFRCLNYKKKLFKTLSSLDYMVTISDEQRKWVVKNKDTYGHQLENVEILNGHYVQNFNHKKIEVNCDTHDFTFGMVGRGIKEKGWSSLITAFVRLDITNKKLLLVGTGPELEKLKKLYSHDEKIIFVGYTPKPIEYIKLFDVAVFSSYTPGESLPTVIIEYLMSNKPIVATDIGAVKEMMQTPDGDIAGILVKYDTEQMLVDQLETNMYLLYKEESLRNNFTELSDQAALKFNMQRCVDSYLATYRGRRQLNLPQKNGSS